MRKKRMNKRAVSLMVSYILLVSIALAMSVGVYVWLKAVANVEPPLACKDETSVIINSYECISGEDGEIRLEIKNNGRFSVKGFVLTIGKGGESPTFSLLNADHDVIGHHFFEPKLMPGESNFSIFLNENETGKVDFERIGSVRIQPFVSDEQDNKIMCPDAVIKQNLRSCKIKGLPIVVSINALASYKNNVPENAIDGNPDTMWNSGSNKSANLTIEFSSNKDIKNYSIQCGGEGIGGGVTSGGLDGAVYFYDLNGNFVGKDPFPWPCFNETINVTFLVSAKKVVIALKPVSIEWSHIKEFRINGKALGLAFCGDGNCDVGEDCDTCEVDCIDYCEEPPPAPVCGDGDCNFGEDCDCVDCPCPGTQICQSGVCVPAPGFTYYCDADGDNYYSSSPTDSCTGTGCVPADCVVSAGDDCDDGDVAIKPDPSITEICNDGKDNDCDGYRDNFDIECPYCFSNPLPGCIDATAALPEYHAFKAFDNNPDSKWDTGSINPANLTISITPPALASLSGYTITCVGKVKGKVFFYNSAGGNIGEDTFECDGTTGPKTISITNAKDIIIEAESKDGTTTTNIKEIQIAT